MRTSFIVAFALTAWHIAFGEATRNTARLASGALPQLRYDFRFVPAGGNKTAVVVVDIIYASPTGSRTAFYVPKDWANQSNLAAEIDSLTLLSSGSLDTAGIAAGHITVTHARNAEVHLRYIVRQDWTGPVARATYFRAIVQPTWFLLTGHNGLIIPDDDVAFDVTMNWNAPAGARIASSWGTGAKQTVHATANQLRNAVYAGGDVAVSAKTDGPTTVTLLSLDSSRPFADSALLRVASTVISTERRFWNEKQRASYLVTLLPSVNDLGGTRYERAMALFADTKYDLQPFVRLIGHESFHEWLGGRMPQPEGSGEAAMKWFAEGFTDYYGDRLMRDAGLLTDSAYGDAVNEVIRSYYASPARDATRDEISAKYWTDPNYNRISYQRGRLFALKLDTDIREATHGAKTIDDMMRIALKLIPDSAVMSDSIVAEAGRRVAGQVVLDDVDTYIRRGAVLDLPPGMLGPCFTQDTVAMQVFDIGFDFNASRAAKRITGVRADTRAYEAGLRDGMEIKGFSFNNGDATKDATIRVAENGVTRAITFRPARPEPLRVPQYQHVAGCRSVTKP